MAILYLNGSLCWISHPASEQEASAGYTHVTCAVFRVSRHLYSRLTERPSFGIIKPDGWSDASLVVVLLPLNPSRAPVPRRLHILLLSSWS